jgi:hypothetical protein
VAGRGCAQIRVQVSAKAASLQWVWAVCLSAACFSMVSWVTCGVGGLGDHELRE